MHARFTSGFPVAKGIKNRLITTMVIAIKILVVTLACIFIYNKVIVTHDLADIIIHYEKLWSLVPFLLLAFVIILVFANWGLEALKWKFTLRNHEKISFTKSVEAVLSGITVSIAAPNRTLEFAGRIFHLEKLNKAQAAMLTIIGSFSQLLVTIIAGALGSLVLVIYYPGLLPDSISDFVPAAIFSALVLTLIFVFINKIPFIFKIGWLKRFYLFMQILKEFKLRDLIAIMGMSAMRYLVFSFQFYLLLIISGVSVSLFLGMILIAVIYFIMTFIPTTIISELAVRGSVSVAILGLVSQDALAIINAGFILWILNLMIPALLGSVFLFKAKLVKSPAVA